MITHIEMDEAKAQLAQRHDVSQPLVDVLERMDQIFQIQSPHAPALVCIGGLVAVDGQAAKAIGTARFSATGNGLSLDQAIVSCLGEAAEILSQFERPGDLVSPSCYATPHLTSGWVGEVLAAPSHPVDWVLGHDAVAKTGILIPADLCLRREPESRAFPVVGALSSGAAASAHWDGAAERAILELIERDAAALWWFGARKPVLFRHDDAAGLEACLLIRVLRAGARDRVTLLLDLTTGLGVPVIAACSYDAAGYGLACGIAARLDRVSAARAAILEMAQMELSTTMAQVKMEQRGASALNDADRRHLARATLHVPSCALFEACAPVQTRQESQVDDRTNTGAGAHGRAKDIALHMTQHKINIYLVDHTRTDIDIPVIRAISPQLQPFSAIAITERLKEMIAMTGGGERHHAGVLPF
jgi:thiazole/oxazole-forming peptide maturase SagD family component